MPGCKRPRPPGARGCKKIKKKKSSMNVEEVSDSLPEYVEEAADSSPEKIGEAPHPELPDYHGPYQREMLEAARADLISIVDNADSTLWKGIWMKTGIYENGQRDLSFEGFGKDSCTYCHDGFPGPIEQPDLGLLNATESSVTSGLHSTGSCEHLVETNEQIDKKQTDVEKASDSDDNVKQLEHEISVPCDETYHSFIYKCDFCNTRHVDDSSMNQHLDSYQHFSASSFWLDEHGNIVQIKDKMSLTNSSAMYRQKLAVCALEKCRRLFSNIFDCASHYVSRHDKSSEPIYSLVDVDEELYKNQINPLECIKCRSPQKSARALTAHYHQAECRMPFVGRGGSYCRFICLKCMQCFIYIRQLLCHQVIEHGSTAVDGQVEMRVLYCSNRTTHYLNNGGKEIPSNDKIELNEMNTLRSNNINDSDRKSDIGHVIVKNEEVKAVFDGLSDCGDGKPSSEDSSFNLPVSAESKMLSTTELDDILMDDETVSNVQDQEILDSETVETNSNDENLLHMKYRCNYCHYLTDKDKEMHTHLQIESHDSASGLYLNQASHVKKMMKLQHINGIFKETLVMCSDRGGQAVIPKDSVASDEADDAAGASGECTINAASQNNPDDNQCDLISIHKSFISVSDSDCNVMPVKDELNVKQTVEDGPSAIGESARNQAITTMQKDSALEICENVTGDATFGSVYKCDFCDMHYETDSPMNQHLVSHEHYSASSYWLDEDRNITCIKDKMSLTNSSAMYRKKLAVCALEKCRRLFSNIFDCASHFVSAHNQSSEPIYSLVDVDEELYKNQLNPLECIKCRNPQKNPRALTAHYHQAECRMPFVGRGGSYCRFICLKCMKCFIYFRQLLCHQVIEHETTAVDGQVEMRVLYFSNRTKHYLNSGGKEIPSNEVMKLNQMNALKSNNINDSDRKSDIGHVTVKNEEVKAVFDGLSDCGVGRPSSEDSSFNFPVSAERKTSTTAELDDILLDDETVSNDQDQEMLDSETAETNSNDENSLPMKYRCNYCHYVSDQDKEMHTHLQIESHDSASGIYLDQANHVKKMMKLQHINGLFKKTLVMCSDRGGQTVILKVPEASDEAVDSMGASGECTINAASQNNPDDNQSDLISTHKFIISAYDSGDNVLPEKFELNVKQTVEDKKVDNEVNKTVAVEDGGESVMNSPILDSVTGPLAIGESARNQTITTMQKDSALEICESGTGDATYSSTCIYKCDFCAMRYEDDSSMNQHLVSREHYSASSYWLDEHRNITCVKDKMSLTNSEAMYRKKVAVCAFDNCRKSFSNIFECAYHFNAVHDQSFDPVYSLVDVVEELYQNQIDPLECIKCGSLEKNPRTLSSHYCRIDCRMPFVGREGSNCRFVCLNCMKSFRNVCLILYHQVIEHRSTAVDGKVEMRVLYCSSRTTHYLNNGGKELSSRDKQKLRKMKELSNDSGKKSDNGHVMTKKGVTVIPNRSPDCGVDKTSSGDSSSNLPVSAESKLSSLAELDDILMNYETLSNVLDQEILDSETVETADVNENSLQVKYKCDYCDYLSDQDEEMRTHLETESHGSASWVSINQANNAMFLKKPLQLQNMHGMFKKVVAVCPEAGCQAVFPNIFVCSEHFSLYHNGAVEPMYALSKIEGTNTAKYIMKAIQCALCGQKFAKQSSLHNHIVSRTHAIYQHSKRCRIYFRCSYCLFFSADYISLAKHINLRHAHIPVEDGVYQMHVMYLNKIKMIKEIPPTLSGIDSRKKGIQERISNLMELKQLTDLDKEKQKIQSQIDGFKKLLGIKDR